MGVALKRDSDAKTFQVVHGQTEELVTWISKIRCKKLAFKRKASKSLRIDAILSSALNRAETELKKKQRERFRKWQLLKSELFKQSRCGKVMRCDKQPLNWDEKTSEEIDSLNTFMSMLKEVKRPLSR